MPELPEVTVYVEALERRVVGRRLEGVRLQSPFLLRSVEPPISAADGRRVTAVSRLGKRLVLSLEGDLHLVLHLMITGRLRWRDEPRAKIPGGKNGLAAFDFPHGTLVLTEMGSKKRASLHLVEGEAALAEHDRGGLEVLDASLEAFGQRLAAESHTLKRALTDPRILSGIGNAYSDEILHRARLSPFKLTGSLDDDQSARLLAAAQDVLRESTETLRRELGDAFPDKLTAHRPEFAVHGRYRQPCPVCATPVQRILYAQNEANYCPTCQTAGKLLADRVLSRLLKKDWPKSVEELEARREASR